MGAVESSSLSEDEFLELKNEGIYDISDIIDIRRLEKNRDKTLNLVFHKEEISPILSEIDEVECKSIDILKNASMLKLIGKGAYGRVFEFQIDKKIYVLKEIDSDLNKYVRNTKNYSILKFATYMNKNYLISKELFLKLNIPIGGTPNDILKVYYIPFFSQLCKSKSEKKVEYNDNSGDFFMVPSGSYMCNSPIFTEYIIGLLCSKLNTDRKSVNFIETNGFTTCSVHNELPELKKHNITQYIFMEKITGPLSSILNKHLSKTDLDSILIQLISSIYTYQTVYGINHNDLHPNNIMYSKINTTMKSVVEGDKLIHGSYFHYNINGKNIYFPASSHIIKIADFGFSVKWSEPIVGSENMISGARKFAPNWFSIYYDISYSLVTVMKTIFEEHRNFSIFSVHCLLKVINYLMTDEQKEKYKTIHNEIDQVEYLLRIFIENVDVKEGRLNLSVCRKIDNKGFDILSIFDNRKGKYKFLEKFLKQPSDRETVVTLGIV
jgi:serine/threonine protein kinase